MTFQEQKKENLKAKIYELETNSNIKTIRDLYRDTSYSKKVYKPRANIVRDEKGDLVTDCHSILARWRERFSQLFDIHGISDARQK